MNLKIYAIYDTKAENFNTPFFMNTNGQAIRAFADLANDTNSTINKHPADYRLFLIGDFDTDSGTVTPEKNTQPLGFASDFIKPDNQIPLFKKETA